MGHSFTRRQFLTRVGIAGAALTAGASHGAEVSGIRSLSGLGLGPIRHAAFLLPGAGAGSAAAVYAQASRFLALHDGAGGIAHGTLQHECASAQSARHLVLTLRMGDGSTATFSALPSRTSEAICTLRFIDASLEVSERGYRLLREGMAPLSRAGDVFSSALLRGSEMVVQDAALEATFAQP